MCPREWKCFVRGPPLYNPEDVGWMGPDRPNVEDGIRQTVSHKHHHLLYTHSIHHQHDVQQPKHSMPNVPNYMEYYTIALRWLPQEDWMPYAGGVIPITTEM